MQHNLPPAELGKYTSAKRALDYVQPDMKIGLGTGSTAAWLVKLLAHEKKHNGLKFEACATSSATTELAESLGMKISSLDDLGQLDLAIDGADEFDPDLNLIKGGGAALLQEKIVETAADKLVIITDASKQVPNLGAFDLPIEVVQFGWKTTQRLVEDALSFQDVDSRVVTRRGGDTPTITDEGHFILDLSLSRIGAPRVLSSALLNIAGVVETGLFLDMADTIVMGDSEGNASVCYKDDDNESIDWINTTIDLQANMNFISGLWNGV